METAKRVLSLMNTLVDGIVILALLLVGIYAAYALWDNSRIFAAAENVQAEMLPMKPKPDIERGNGNAFAKLREINPDVCAWLTLDHTKIDYPVLQGSDNLSYINTDVYGNFSLAGSIFIDSRSDRAFRDAYSLLYGHHMEKSKMFGDLDLYRVEDFFSENSTGMLILPERAYRLKIFACLSVSASENVIFDPQQTGIPELLAFVSDNALRFRPEVIDRSTAAGAPLQILGMSTCSSEFTDARTVVLAVMEPCLSEH